ncbi:hypothetical protein ACRQ5Q_42890 (plasmid) [Bradyrhizobium sp. PMVTL-01]|uniref:hypothetical protein n=1 Tax=Bradyrhizobium sp. PMVTL-01 TaxID=3434999 RepID=UPI003F72BF21
MTRGRPDPELEAMFAELAEICKDLTPLESALLVADGFRDVYGGEWRIEAHVDGSFWIVKHSDQD